MEQKDTYLIFLKEKVRDGILTSTVALSVELGLLILTWVKAGWQMVVLTSPVWFILALVHYFVLTETFDYWKRYKEYLGSRSVK